jgi:hypothetical protein
MRLGSRSLVLCLVPAIAAALPALLAACSTAKLSGPASDDASCRAQIEFGCNPGPAGGPGCAPSSTSTDPVLSLVPPDASYPTGCAIVVYDPTPDDQGQCIQRGTCHCNAADGGAAWTCAK